MCQCPWSVNTLEGIVVINTPGCLYFSSSKRNQVPIFVTTGGQCVIRFDPSPSPWETSSLLRHHHKHNQCSKVSCVDLFTHAPTHPFLPLLTGKMRLLIMQFVDSHCLQRHSVLCSCLRTVICKPCQHQAYMSSAIVSILVKDDTVCSHVKIMINS